MNRARWKEVVVLVAVLATFVGYVVYIKGFAWTSKEWTFVGAIAFAGAIAWILTTFPVNAIIAFTKKLLRQD